MHDKRSLYQLIMIIINLITMCKFIHRFAITQVFSTVHAALRGLDLVGLSVSGAIILFTIG